MGIEQRRNGVYYYEKCRINGRVRSIYCGSGTIAEHKLFLSVMQSTREANERAQWNAHRAKIEEHDALFTDIDMGCQQLAAALLLASGQHQHKGTWRKRRMTRTITLKVPPRRPQPGDMSAEALKALMERCNETNADPEDISLLRAMIPAHPHITSLSNQIGVALGILASEGGGLGKATGEAYIIERKKAMGYDEAPSLEQPLILHVIMCEQRLGIVERSYSAAERVTELPIKHRQFYEGRLNAAQARYLKAVETLARIRRVRVELFASDGTRSAGMAVERPGK